MPRNILAPSEEWSGALPLLERLSALLVGNPTEQGGDNEQATSESSWSDQWATDTENTADEEATVEQSNELEQQAQVAAQSLEATAAVADASTAEHPEQTAPVQYDSINKLCRLLWRAAVKGRSYEDFKGSEPLPADTQYLLFLADDEQLFVHLTTAVVRALETLCKAAKLPTATQVAAAAVAAANTGRQAQVAEAKASAAIFEGSSSAVSSSRQQPPAQSIKLELSKHCMLPALQLMLVFASCARCYNIYASNMSDYLSQFAHKMMLMHAVDMSGLGRMLGALCQDLAAALKQQQQQQQQRHAVDAECRLCTRILASATLHCIRFCVLADRPAQIFWDQVLGPILQPAVTLAATLQRVQQGAAEQTTEEAAPAAAGTTLAAEMDVGTSTAAASAAADFDEWVAMWRDDSAVGQEPIALTSNLTTAVCQAYYSYKGPDPVLVNLLASDDMQQLMILYTAARAQNLWNQAGGRIRSHGSAGSSSSDGNTSQPPQQQQQQEEQHVDVPAWHSQLYTACGLAAGSDLTRVFVVWDDRDPNLSVLNVLTLMVQLSMMDFWKQHLGNLNSTAGLLQVREELQQHLQQQGGGQQQDQPVRFLAQPELRVGLLLVLVETLVLCPGMKLGVLTLKLMMAVAIKGWCFSSADSGVAAVQPGNAVAMQGNPEGALVSIILQWLPTAYFQLLDTYKPSSEHDVTAGDVKTLQECYAATVALVVTADALSGGRELTRVLAANPPATCRALEAAVRAGNYGHLLSIDTQLLMKSLVQTPFHSTSHLPRATPLAAVTAVPEVTPAGLSRASAASSVELFALLLSSLKFTAAHVAASKGIGQGPVQLLQLSVNILNTVRGLSCSLPAPVGHQQNSVIGTILPHRWLVLAGMALVSYAKASAAIIRDATRHNATQESGSVTVDFGNIYEVPGVLLNSLTRFDLAAWHPAVAALDAAAHAELMRLGSTLAAELTSSIRDSTTPTGSPGPMTEKQFVTGLLDVYLSRAPKPEQFEAYGTALCSLLPVPYCCNNPNCTNLKGNSELSAVKQKRCSSCKVAHYCCAKCQKEHWGQHKAVCKRLKEDSAAVQAFKDAA